jgi:formylglycine-generating enzyme required for sulfatase activity
MGAYATVGTDLGARLLEARARTDALFNLLRPDAIYERPVPERHRLIFYYGHLEAFDWNLLCVGASGRPSFHPAFDQLFAFGIDPGPGRLPQDQPSDWPSFEEVHRYNAAVRRAVDAVADQVLPETLHIALEHRLMHAETFTYLLHALAPQFKRHIPVFHSPSGPPPPLSMVDIPGGTATLGRSRGPDDLHPFGWDNEFPAQEIHVPAFAMSKYKVTNGQYLEFVRSGAKPPYFWARHDGQWWWRTMFGEVPLPLDWPVYVTWQEAQAYANWAGKSLPSEAQFHRAAYGTEAGEERTYPWGGDSPDRRRGNFDFQRWDPVPVTATPMGESSLGVSQLVGNGWEWTATVFHPFPGFEPCPAYPGYSAPFFDSDHYVLKGASPRTAACFLRRPFRNWFRSSYRYVYAGFRCVEH